MPIRKKHLDHESRWMSLYVKHPLMLRFDIAHLSKWPMQRCPSRGETIQLHSPIYLDEEGADIVHSTKYLAGHNDNGWYCRDKCFELVHDTIWARQVLFFIVTICWSVISKRSLSGWSAPQKECSGWSIFENLPSGQRSLYTGKGGMVSFKIQRWKNS